MADSKSDMKTGIGFGRAWAIALSVHLGYGFWDTVLRGLFGWIYVLYHYLHAELR